MAQGNASKKIIVVDDNADSGEMLVTLVSMWGHDAVHVSDGAKALDLADTFLPDIVLLDIGLPGMDGYEVARRLREKHTTTRIIAVSGYGQDSDRKMSRAAGCDDHIVKPVDVAKLEKSLAAL